MSVLASKRGILELDRKFSKELFTEVAENLKVFSDYEWESVKDSLEYKKVLIAVYIRTDLDNLVLLVDDDKFAKIFDVPSFIADSGVYPNMLLDSGFVCGKELIDLAFKFKSEEAMNRFVRSSICYPVGAVETLKKYALVYNVIISESLLRDEEISLNKGFHFHPIESLHLTDLIQRDIAESLVIVKSEDRK